MKMCMRCGSKGLTQRWRITVNNGPSAADEYVLDQEFHLCADCTKAALNQLSVVISNETWPGDKEPPCTA